tara:strand:- start:497 stop:706 length:210 start_codon:yes stop_codon:yes gene_type:complete
MGVTEDVNTIRRALYKDAIRTDTAMNQSILSTERSCTLLNLGCDVAMLCERRRTRAMCGPIGRLGLEIV